MTYLVLQKNSQETKLKDKLIFAQKLFLNPCIVLWLIHIFPQNFFLKIPGMCGFQNIFHTKINLSFNPTFQEGFESPLCSTCALANIKAESREKTVVPCIPDALLPVCCWTHWNIHLLSNILLKLFSWCDQRQGSFPWLHYNSVGHWRGLRSLCSSAFLRWSSEIKSVDL